MSKYPFDDFLDLSHNSFAAVRLVVLVGASGSGKSTVLRFLATQHPAFTGRQDVIVLDDVESARDLFTVLRRLAQGRTVLVAAHLPAGLFRVFRVFGRTVILRTDRDVAKIQRYLAWRGLPCSEEAARRFCQMYGASYTDADIVLETGAADDFDARLAQFTRCCRMERGTRRRGARRGA